MKHEQAVPARFRMPDAMWERVEGLLPRRRKSRKGGRPPLDWRPVLDGIFYVLRTGCQWKAAPSAFGSGSSLHRYFQRLVRRGVFADLWTVALLEYDDLVGLEWKWQALDGATTKAPLGGKKTGKNPTDRAKGGTKRSLLTDGNGIPIGVAVSGANTHDMRLVQETFASVPVEVPDPGQLKPHLCADKGYDYEAVREVATDQGYVAHIPKRGEKAKSKTKDARKGRKRARRWVVERTHSWMNRFRRLLVRWEKKAKNYLAMIHLASAFIAYSAAGVLG